jgi:hypothetical protein
MKTLFLSLMLIAAFFGSVSAGNLITDPDMEAKNTAVWDLRNAAFTEEGALTGKVACAVSPGTAGAGVWQTVAVKTDTDYVVMAWIKMASWTDLGWFCVKLADGDTIKQAVTHKGWLLYAIPFKAKGGSVSVGWMMDANTSGSWCDMFALTRFNNLLQDPGIEDSGADVAYYSGWTWGAWAVAEGVRTGSGAWMSDAAGGGGWGFYPPFDENDIIIAGAWIKTGDFDTYEPGFIDRATGSNLGWWAVRTKQHESEINLIYSDIDYYQYVIPYKIPANATSPEIMWWQSWGQSTSYCDDLFLIESPYADSQVPWGLIQSDPDSNWGFFANPEDPDWPNAPSNGVFSRDAANPVSFSLEQNFPNPFNPSTGIAYTLDRAQDVTLAVYNLSGDRVAVLAEGRRTAGAHTAHFNASGLSSGIYVCRLKTHFGMLTRKMLFVQ